MRWASLRLSSNNCSVGNLPAAPGFVFTPYATGFNAQTIVTDVNFGCQGATGLGFEFERKPLRQ